MWQLGNFDKSLQDRNLYLRWRWGDCCFTSNPTEGPTSLTAVINRVIVEKNTRLRYWRLDDVRSSILVRLLIRFFCVCLLMPFPCTWWHTTKDLLDKCNTSPGIIFQIGNNSVNLILPLQNTRNNEDQNSFRSLPIVCTWYRTLLEQVKNHSSLFRVHVNWII